MPKGIYPRESAEARFWRNVDRTGPGGCWLWTASVDTDGYGGLRVDGRRMGAHRFAYELLVGPIPDGLQIDHVRLRGCTHRNCVNPAHLEPVTNRENVLRGLGPTAVAARRTHCPQGHAYSPQNTGVTKGGGRYCRTCHRERAHARWVANDNREIVGVDG